MSKLTDTLTVWQRENTRADASYWVCTWKAETRGEFYLLAGHFCDARQTAKRVLRDHMKIGAKVTFSVCEASLLDRGWLALAGRQQRIQEHILMNAATPGQSDSDGPAALTLKAKPTSG